MSSATQSICLWSTGLSTLGSSPSILSQNVCRSTYVPSKVVILNKFPPWSPAVKLLLKSVQVCSGWCRSPRKCTSNRLIIDFSRLVREVCLLESTFEIVERDFSRLNSLFSGVISPWGFSSWSMKCQLNLENNR